MIAIAIISLIGLIVCISQDIFDDDLRPPQSHSVQASIAVIAWWNICFFLAMVALIIGAIWLLVSTWAFIQSKNQH